MHISILCLFLQLRKIFQVVKAYSGSNLLQGNVLWLGQILVIEVVSTKRVAMDGCFGCYGFLDSLQKIPSHSYLLVQDAESAISVDEPLK